MPDQVKFRGGTTAQHVTFTGAVREITVDTDKKVAVIHDGATPGGFPLLRQDLANLPDDANISISGMDPSAFYKVNVYTPAFVKNDTDELQVLPGTRVKVHGTNLTSTANTLVIMPTLTTGVDYAIFACTDNTFRAAASAAAAPAGYTTANSRKIGGFHYGTVAPTADAGGFATTGPSMNWTQADVNAISGINRYSIWDLRFRPTLADPRGMALVGGTMWVDIYLCSTDADAQGTSASGTNIASGTVLPRIPRACGGDGTQNYTSLNWWVASEIARAHKKRLIQCSVKPRPSGRGYKERLFLTVPCGI